jgi:superfamily II DNA or RNA helicase
MKFQKELYPYQKEILSVFDAEQQKWEKKIHIVAPPGSGKTIIGCEIMCRIGAPTLILVPNLTLLGQWQDKLEKHFFEAGETSDELISTSIEDIKMINILTYQSLSGSDDTSDEIQEEIYELWYQSEKSDFTSKELFLEFLRELKEWNPEEYQEEYAKQRKKVKNSGDSDTTRKMMKEKILSYTKKLREYGVKTMIVDEAHHLTSWWSHVLFEIWSDLSEPTIIGLTATPPFDDVDYFELDLSYTKLLGTVDYIVPTPAIVRSGRLAPYSDLLYIVSPGADLDELLKKREAMLATFIELHKWDIVAYLHEYLQKNYENLKTKSWDMCDKWMRFIYVHKWADIDMSSYIHGGISDTLSLEDIAKSIGKWASDGFKKSKKSEILDEVKSLFFDLGYIWRWANLYRFETPVEKWLIYAKSKIEGVKAILKKEEQNLGDNLKCAIITDFLDVESDWINCHAIFDAVSESFGHLSPYIVSGQGIWKLEKWAKVLAPEETILTVTEKLQKWEIKMVIGTRGILGEGWDCPELNTLIDLTGVSAYMSVNQVHGRAIRLDPTNLEKVANIYDIVCIGEWYQWLRDFERIMKKHAQFYGVDDAGLIIKWLDHIYPQLEKNIVNPERINQYTLKKSELRSMVKELWNVGEDFKNEEIFSLSLEVRKPYSSLYLPSNIGLYDLYALNRESTKDSNLLEFWKTKYHEIVRKWITEMIDATLQVLKPFEHLPSDFSYSLKWTPSGSISIVSDYHDPLISKKFIDTIALIFDTITDQKYVFSNKEYNAKWEKGWKKASSILWQILATIFVWFSATLWIIIWVFPSVYYLYLHVLIISYWCYLWILKYTKNKLLLFREETRSTYSEKEITFWLPNPIVSNEEKRNYLLGKKYNTIPLHTEISTDLKKLLFINPTNIQKMIHSNLKIEEQNIPTILEVLKDVTLWILSVFVAILITPICFLLAIIGTMLFIPYFLFYISPVIIMNYMRRRKIIELAGNIVPTEKSDIGKPQQFSAKIEKLWI